MIAFTPNDQRVIIERRHGAEQASAGTLADVFGTSAQHIASICRTACASCGERICGCTDDAWLGSR